MRTATRADAPETRKGCRMSTDTTTGVDPALRRLERAYRAGGTDLDRMAWITALLTRDLIEGNEVQFLAPPAGFGCFSHQKRGPDRWWYVERYVRATAELVAPGVWRMVHASNACIVPLHKNRLVLLKEKQTFGCSPEFWVTYVKDWRPARVVLKASS